VQHDAPAASDKEHCRQTIEAAPHAHRPQVPALDRARYRRVRPHRPSGDGLAAGLLLRQCDPGRSAYMYSATCQIGGRKAARPGRAILPTSLKNDPGVAGGRWGRGGSSGRSGPGPAQGRCQEATRLQAGASPRGPPGTWHRALVRSEPPFKAGVSILRTSRTSKASSSGHVWVALPHTRTRNGEGAQMKGPKTAGHVLC
jgi:hypothetical protein